MLAGVTDCRRSRKWGCRGRLALGFKTWAWEPYPREGHVVLGEKGEYHAVLAEWIGALQNHKVFSLYGCHTWVLNPSAPSAAPFPTPPTIGYTCQHSLFFQLYWAAAVSLGRCGPMAWSQSSPKSLTGPVTRGRCLPVTSWVEVTPIPPAQSKATAI